MPIAPQIIVAADGRRFRLRPIRPSDAPALMEGYETLPDRQKWFRMLHAVPHLTPELARRLCTIDPARDVCLVLEPEQGGPIVAGARLMGDGAGAAEFAVSVRGDHQGLGLGRAALRAALEAGRRMGLRRIWGEIAAQNGPMLGLARSLGFSLRPDPDEPGLVLAELRPPEQKDARDEKAASA
ncbi:GNAT family N-acetyltransferase [Oceanicella actignis]|uniref:Acetyltransferase n=1 Tax=Oceanicella actignis TaxID=1189325 RepID=A0A1M7T2P9_9RHOB|nr:GNAT family N-acetyltransferase [Oceanicella actignis]TYO88865.1 acetyltransferase [Oceanicella actignis]SET39225.1 acetyltransferase [Oceanicella actignis]SHN64944.1 acetyltransferase [Oceanicella actignis]